jgi:hypothetical protein
MKIRCHKPGSPQRVAIVMDSRFCNSLTLRLGTGCVTQEVLKMTLAATAALPKLSGAITETTPPCFLSATETRRHKQCYRRKSADKVGFPTGVRAVCVWLESRRKGHATSCSCRQLSPGTRGLQPDEGQRFGYKRDPPPAPRIAVFWGTAGILSKVGGALHLLRDM